MSRAASAPSASHASTRAATTMRTMPLGWHSPLSQRYSVRRDRPVSRATRATGHDSSQARRRSSKLVTVGEVITTRAA